MNPPAPHGSRLPTPLTRRSLLVAAALLYLSAFPDPTAAQTVSFVARQDFVAGQSPKAVAVSDFNGDGQLDIVVAGADGVSVLLGRGDGTFQAAQTFPAGSSPVSVAVGDFNGDGKPDLAVAGADGVSVLLGLGDGAFPVAGAFVSAAAPGTGAAGARVGEYSWDV